MDAPADALWPVEGQPGSDPILPSELTEDTTFHPSPRTRQAVLVVDDDHEIRAVLRDLFDDEGFRVYEAANGADGLKLLGSAGAPVVLLLDLMMPGMDGFEVCRRLAADPHLRDGHAVILMSARRNLQVADCRGVQATIAKPFEIDKLLDLVEHLATRPVPPADEPPPDPPPMR
ncbi:MAG TPA: response regulator [Ktedonobacterales bacterium]|jgi:CheY-like chemotaxis protein